MRDRRDTRVHREQPLSVEPGSPEDLKVPPPSVALMEHLWKRFGDAPRVGDLQAELHPGYNAVALLASQGGREEVLRYLQDLLHGDGK